ncbi:MAG TPA: hypothetical protein VJ063_14100 [Verrucomicrobiae bacterium]|nr:hypothetical protein [Verrucomicrobiae bacterium]
MRAFWGLVGPLWAAVSVFGVEVHVVDRETGRPIAGASVISKGVTNTTDVVGRASADGPNVMVHKRGYAPMKMETRTNAEFRLVLAETLRGRAIDGSGNPVAGGTITVIVPGPLSGTRFAVEDFPVTSDAEGRWVCEFVPKDSAYVRLEFSHPDFEWPEQNVSLPAAELKVYRVGTISGRVLNDSGEPVTGATVVLGDEHFVQDEPVRRTDTAGKFAFSRQRPQRRLIGIDAEGWAPTIEVVNTNFSPVEVRLQKGKPWRFRVEDEAGQALAGVNASVAELEGPNGSRWFYWDRTWKTDVQGTFIWTNAPDRTCTWNFSKIGYMGRSHLQFKPSDGETAVKLGPAFRVTGVVLDAATQKPIPAFILNGRYVQPPPHSPGTWYDHERKTFRHGEFSLDYERTLYGGSGPMHDWQFRVEADGYEPAVSRVIRDAERGTNIVFELKRQATPQIQVTAPTGKQRVTAVIALQPANVAPGETVTVFIKARIAEGHWIYSLEKSGSENSATRIEGKLPRDIQQEGPWRGPEPKLKADGARTIAGEALFSCRLLAGGYSRPAKHKLQFKFEFQVCNDLVCWPPESIDMEAELEVVKPR